MKIPNNERQNRPQRRIQNEQSVKQQDLGPYPGSIYQEFQEPAINSKKKQNGPCEINVSQIQVKVEPQQNTAQQFCQLKESSDVSPDFPEKTKKISKHHNNDRIDNSLYSNSNRKLVNIIRKYLEKLGHGQNFKQNYLKPYEIYGDRQNIVILPFLVLDCVLKEVMKMYAEEMNGSKIIIKVQGLKQKINQLFSVLRGIFTQYKQGLQRSKEKKQTKKRNCEANDHNQGEYISMADYFNNTIPELFLIFVTKKFKIPRQELNYVFKLGEEKPHRFQVKVEEETTMKFVTKTQENPSINPPDIPYSMQVVKKCKDFIKRIFPFKEKEIIYALDRFFSVRFGLPLLRQVFQFPYDYILDVKKIVFISKAEEHKRESGRGKKSLPYHMEKIYSRINLSQTSLNHITKNNINSLGEEFLRALLAISLMKQKHVEVLENFLASINRKIQYLSDQQGSEDYNTSQFINQGTLKYKKLHYNHFLNLLSRDLHNQSVQKNHLSDGKKPKSMQKKYGRCLRISISEWIYPPFFQSQDYLCKIEQQQIIQNSTNLDSLKSIISAYVEAQKQLQGQIQQNGITLIFHE